LWGAETTADSAHNVLLDVASSGGVFLALFYLGFILLALKSIYKVIFIQKISDPFFISIIGAWFAYQAQSLISINQLGLGVWGWSLTGLIIGYGFKVDSSELNLLKKTSDSKKIQGSLPPLAIVTTFISVIAGLAITIPPYNASKNFYDSLVTGDPSKIQNSVYQKPYDRFFYIYVARVMLSNSYNSEAIKILSDASILYPDSTEIWQIWSAIPTASQDQINRAKSELRRLDPLNPNLK
jgi:DNA-dependent RNA polymerase auxiliary subunit epsilon